ncbi:MAG: undecaprenyl-diphosphate phosphatase [Bacteroidota bacterium]|nr:undecaprenyl-diphosphate phosphatase [Bacteroidota bacterium]
MIEEIKYFLIGIIQGLAEFFPVSSSGHIVLLSSLLEISNEHPLLLSITVHFATTLSTIIVFRKKIFEIIHELTSGKQFFYQSMFFKILVSSTPIFFVGLLFKNNIESFFLESYLVVAIMLIITGIILLTTNFMSDGKNSISLFSAFIIGIAQAIAVVPGISRSGLTISTALFLRTSKKEAAEFSFIMVLVPIIGITILEFFLFFKSSTSISLTSQKTLIISFLSSFISGLIACKYMISIVKYNNLKYFGFYCILIAFVVIFITQL